MKNMTNERLERIIGFDEEIELEAENISDILNFQEGEVPRVPAGSPSGGQWTSGSEISYNEAKEAINYYTDTGYNTINNYLRGVISDKELKTLPEEKIKKQIAALDHFLEKAPADMIIGNPESGLRNEVYRGVKFNSKEKFDEFVSGVENSGYIFDKGFLSTSFDPKVPFEFLNDKHPVFITIKGKSGVALMEAVDDDRWEAESEVLFKRGTKFKFISKEFRKNVLHLNLEEV